MTSPAIHLPTDPLGRFQEVFQAIRKDARWWSSFTCLRYAALSLTTMEGNPTNLARQLWSTAEKLRRGGGWASPLQSSIRFLVAASLMRHSRSPDRFFNEVERVVAFFRESKLPRGRAHEMLATIVLQQQALAADYSQVRREQVRRLHGVFKQMKADHPWLTTPDDYPCAALLSGGKDSPKQISSRVEALYQGLRQYRFSKGNALQTVSHMLYLHPEPDHEVLRRFQNLYHAFKGRKLWMWENDYDEIACLTYLSQSTPQIVETVLKHRESIKAMKPRIGANEHFSLACNTAFLELIGNARDMHWIVDLVGLIQAKSVLAAQQAAAASAAT
jgi:hypothetical protein